MQHQESGSKPEQIVNLQREIDIFMANGKIVLKACKQTGISDHKKYYRWRKIYVMRKRDSESGGHIGARISLPYPMYQHIS